MAQPYDLAPQLTILSSFFKCMATDKVYNQRLLPPREFFTFMSTKEAGFETPHEKTKDKYQPINRPGALQNTDKSRQTPSTI